MNALNKFVKLVNLKGNSLIFGIAVTTAHG